MARVRYFISIQSDLISIGLTVSDFFGPQIHLYTSPKVDLELHCLFMNKFFNFDLIWVDKKRMKILKNSSIFKTPSKYVFLFVVEAQLFERLGFTKPFTDRTADFS